MKDMMGKLKKKWGMQHVMTDTSCGEEALHPRAACVRMCCCNLSGWDDVSHVEGKMTDVCVSV